MEESFFDYVLGWTLIIIMITVLTVIMGVILPKIENTKIIKVISKYL